MGAFFQEIFNLLTSDTGSLTYQLVLAFSVAGALPGALSLWRGGNVAQARRMATGLFLLLVIRLGMFAASGLAWQGIFDPQVLLPPLDRGATLLSLLVIVWMWAFPRPARMADTAALLVGLLTLTLITLGSVWWSDQAAERLFNGSFPDTIAEIAALTFIGVGALLLLIRRPEGWPFGMAMLALLFAGHLAYLIVPTLDANFSGAVRLAQMAAYPMLLLLPQRFPLGAPAERLAPAGETWQPAPSTLDVGAVPALLTLATETDAEKMCGEITSAVARAMRADVCLLISPPNGQGGMTVECGYDLISESDLPGAHLEVDQAPGIADVMRGHSPFHLGPSSEAPDAKNLARIMDLERAGDLLAVAVGPYDDLPVFALVLMSPYSERKWTDEDLKYFERIVAGLIRLLHRNQQLISFQDELAESKEETEQMLEQVRTLEREKEELVEQISTLRQNLGQDRSQISSVFSMLSAEEELQEQFLQLQRENEALREAVESTPDEAVLQEVDQVKEELRLTLQEVALLKGALSDADQKLLQAKDQPETEQEALTAKQVDHILTMAQDLRHPMSSIIGYTDFLLGESVGILGSLQRKYLERVRISVERMARIVDEIIQSVRPEGGNGPLKLQKADMNTIIDKAILNTSDKLREKEISLRVDLPEDLPKLEVDQEVLQRVLLYLLDNASAVTPEEGDLQLRARMEINEGQQDYILLQITDEGGGIAVEDMPRVFSPVRSQTAIKGLGETEVEMSTVKTLVEALGGRIWVDSEPGQGSTFSVVFPVAPSEDSSNGFHGAQAV